MGTHERFIAYLIEHFGGAFPTWLAPIQVRLIPVSERFVEYAEKLMAELRTRMIRTEIDRHDEKMGKKIREAVTAKIPILLVVGEKEMADGSVTVRRYGEQEQAIMPFDEFLIEVENEIRERVMRRKPGL